jgi:NADP-dependent 3-hydroxy acid dehydrogenase YdfG
VLDGRTALVTGASAGIGRAIAVGLAAEGMAVHLMARRPAPLAAVAAEISASGGTASVWCGDMGDEPAVRSVAAAVTAAGPLDVLVHSAGVIAIGPVAEAAVAELDRQWQINVRGPFLLTQLLLPALRARRGQIVFVNSSAGLSAAPGVSQYAATKHALKAIADSLRAEVNRDGVRVVSVYPGRTATPMQEALHRAEGKAYDPAALMQPEDVAAVVLSALRLPPTAEVTDLRVRPATPP